MQVKLNKRLLHLSAFIENNERVIDIGCDHGLLGIYLCQNRNNIKVVGSDINELPLKKAEENLIKYGLEEKIELRLGNGLETVSKDLNTIVISGMGGVTIINILKDINRFPNIDKIIISPNNDFPLTRREVTKLGFKVTLEEIIEERGKYYLISKYVKGKEKTNYFFGKVKMTPDAKKYYMYLIEKNEEKLRKIPNKYFLEKIKLKYQNLVIKKHLK